ncbi:MAG: response regulator [Gammaproteobacteria bacterium]|nr:response regulator [Gammaproteobacteria bacterium]
MMSLVLLPLYLVHLLHHRTTTDSQVDDRRKSYDGAIGKVRLFKIFLHRYSSRFVGSIKLTRHDELGREQGQAIVRTVILVCLIIYLTATHYPVSFAAGLPGWLAWLAGFFILSVVMMVFAFRDVTTSIPRRTATNIGDIGTISYLMISTGEAGVPLFVLYLWVTLGNGFRFGLTAMLVSTLLSIAGFSVVVVVSHLWQGQGPLAAGIFGGLVLLPGYAAHLIRQLHQARMRAEEASATKSQFLARMSHELRTPLNGILGATELLEANRRLTPEERSLLGMIRDSAHVSLRQIGDVLDFSKIEAGKLVLERATFDLHEVLRAAADMVRPSAIQKELRLLVRIAPTTPFQLNGDAHRLRDILLNLLSNAVKFTEHGYVSLEVSSSQATASERATVRFEVRDTGIGISPQALERIFLDFTQEDSSTTRKHGGTGLGTTIAKQLVELMGGRIGVQSVKDQGTLFWFEIPFEQQPAVAEEPTLPGTRALLLSVDSLVIKHFSESVESLQGQLVRVTTGEGAITALTRAIHLGNRVQAIFVDASLALQIAGANRFEELCVKAQLANVPAILVSNVVVPEVRQREWGYAAVLPCLAERRLIYAALHASPVPSIAVASNSVVSVAPWLWNQRDGARPRILAVDDNRINLTIVSRMLEQAGYQVDTKQTGEEALDALATNAYRLAILDMHMPVLDGLGVLRRYRLLRGRSRVPVIILTANATLEAQQQSADAGADAYLSKPVAMADLLNLVERLLNENEIQQLPLADEASEAAEAVVLQKEVLAELDRLYHDPRELSRIIEEYAVEGTTLLEKITEACAAHNYAVFCDWVHAFKGNAANVGAVKLMQMCCDAETAGVLEFRRAHDHQLERMQLAFDESLSALRRLVRVGASQDRDEISDRP